MAISTVLNQTLRHGELRRGILAPQLETNVTKFKGKTFTGNRKLVDIIANAKAQGVAVDDYNFRLRGADHIAFGNASGKRPDGSPLVSCGVVGPFVLYNTFNGKFFGRTDKGVDFDSSSTVHEREPWFQQLLEFFYTCEKSAEIKAFEKVLMDVVTQFDKSAPFIVGLPPCLDEVDAPTDKLQGAISDFVDAVAKGGKATANVKRIKGGISVTLKAKKGRDLRDVLPAMSAQGLYQVDSSDGGAY